jgi:hypothetical protein
MKNMVVLLIVVFLLAAVTPAMAGPPDKGLGQGWKEYVTVKVDWDGNPSDEADWNVYAGPYYVTLHPSYTVGDFVTGCSACLDMSSYTFSFVGKTLQFSETYVSGVEAYPQTHHVVLHNDGTGVYTGSITARYDFPGSAAGVTRMDVIQYTVTTSGRLVTAFHYDEVEYIQPSAGQ